MPASAPHLLARPQDIPADLRLDAPLSCTRFLLNGELRAWDGPMQEVRSPIFVPGPDEDSPSERALLGFCPVHDADTGLLALDAASRAWGSGLGPWPSLPPEARLACVEDFCARMRTRRADIVRLMVWEICKSRAEAEQEFDRTVEYIDASVASLRALLAETAAPVSAGSLRARLSHAPLGVALCMGPFNFPLNETLATLIPALLMGNTAVVKLPKIGRLLFWPLLDCLHQAFPRGVVNVLSGGVECVAPAMATGRVDVLAFIGTSRAAEAMRALHPHPNRLRCVLGLEAKNAAIVLEDADLDAALPELVRGALGFNGQRCTALKVLFVHRSLEREFLERFDAAVRAQPVGLPWESGVRITPLPEPGKPQRLDALVRDALAKGARLVTPGGPQDETLYAPAVLCPVTPDMRLFREEQFGPVVPVALFDDPTEVLDAIAASDYGQQASVFGRDAARMEALARALQNLVSRVNLNCKCQRGPDTLPFTGRRDSAVGTLSVRDGLLAFSIPALTTARNTDAASALLPRL